MSNPIYRNTDEQSVREILLSSGLVNLAGGFTNKGRIKNISRVFGNLIDQEIPFQLSLKHKVFLIITNNSQRKNCSICNSHLDDDCYNRQTCSDNCHRELWKTIYNTPDPNTGKSLATLVAEKAAKSINYVEVGKKVKATKRQTLNELGQDVYEQTAIKSAITRNGSYVGTSVLSDYRKYYHKVKLITKKQDISSLINSEKRSGYNQGNDDPYQLDHQFSISKGFENSIPPYIIGHICNLEMLPSKINARKSSQCSISKEQLFAKFDQWQTGLPMME